MVIALLSGAIRAIERLERRPDELRLLLQRSLESNHHFLGRRKYGHHAARDEFAGGHQQRLDGDFRAGVAFGKVQCNEAVGRTNSCSPLGIPTMLKELRSRLPQPFDEMLRACRIREAGNGLARDSI
jgi:hypothetical protein